MSEYEYEVMIEEADEGGYVVVVPDLDYLTTQGETIEEARAMVRDAITGYLAVLKQKGLPIPPGHVRRFRAYERITVAA